MAEAKYTGNYFNPRTHKRHGITGNRTETFCGLLIDKGMTGIKYRSSADFARVTCKTCRKSMIAGQFIEPKDMTEEEATAEDAMEPIPGRRVDPNIKFLIWDKEEFEVYDTSEQVKEELLSCEEEDIEPPTVFRIDLRKLNRVCARITRNIELEEEIKWVRDREKCKNCSLQT